MSSPTTLDAPRMSPVRPHQARPPRQRLSEEILGIDWSRYLPWPLGAGGAMLRLADYAEVQGFAARHHRELVAPEIVSSGFSQLEEGPLKARFCERAADSFVVEHEGEAVGVFVGQLQDWSTYYMRYFAMRPRFRGAGVVPDLIDRFSEMLAPHGVERLEYDVAVSHRNHLRRLFGYDAYVMGTVNSERWGAMVHLVQFLSERHEAVFLDQFTAGLRSRGRMQAGRAR